MKVCKYFKTLIEKLIDTFLFLFFDESVVTTSTPERQDGIALLQEAIGKIEETIKKLGGSFNVQMAPKVVTALDEAELARMMDRLELENQEVAGDDDEEDENEEEDDDEEEEETKENGED